MTAYDALRASYEEERPRYVAAVEEVKHALRTGLEEARIDANVSGRAKTVESFVKKAIRKSVSDSDEIGDKGGIRITYTFPDNASQIEEVITQICAIRRKEVKSDGLGIDLLGYQGVHLDVVTENADSLSELSRGLPMEIQLQTKAQNAWSSVTHDLFYKSPIEIPVEIKRGFNRLSALGEIFDSEVSRLVGEVEKQPDFELVELLEQLDNEIVKFASQRPDQALTRISAAPLVELYDCPPAEIFATRILPFIEANRQHLDRLFDEYEGDGRLPLLFQPEALMIFERIVNDRDRLVEVWPAELLPRELLESLAIVWGEPLPSIQ